MKNYFTLLAFCLPVWVFSQDIVLDPPDSVYGEYPINEWVADYIYVKNNTNAPMNIDFEVVDNGFLPGWTTNFCTNLHCYNYIPGAGTLGTIAPGEEGFLTCSIGFWEVLGTGTCIFRVFNADDPAVADTIPVTYHVVDEISGTHDLANEFHFSVSPNPASGTLTLTNEELEHYEVRIYSSTGQMVRHEKVTGKNWQGNIAELNPGLYILTVANEKGLIFRNKISKL